MFQNAIREKPASSWSSSSSCCPSCLVYCVHVLKLCVFGSYTLSASVAFSVVSLTNALLMTAFVAGSGWDMPVVTLGCMFRALVSLFWLREMVPDRIASGRHWGSPTPLILLWTWASRRVRCSTLGPSLFLVYITVRQASPRPSFYYLPLALWK